LRIGNGVIIQTKALELKRVLDETRERGSSEAAVRECSFSENITIDDAGRFLLK
jgi:hypothetical protein